MTAILVHRSGSLAGQKSTCDEEIVSLGRKADNHVVFEDEIVSSHHAEIRRQRDTYTLFDLKSRNGTFVNGKRVQKSQLRDRDQVEMGANGPVFEFRVRAKEERTGPRINPVSGSWEHGKGPIELERKRTTLGRGTDNDIVVGRVSDSVVSSSHAEIRVHSDYCELEDLDSSNGTYVNGRRIRSARLEEGDRVELGEGGPAFEFEWKGDHGKKKGGSTRESERMIRKLDRASKGGPVGDRTAMLLDVAHKYYKRRRWPLLVSLSAILVVAVAAGIFAFIQTKRIEQLTQRDNFYEIRLLEARLVGERESKSVEELKNLRDKQIKLEQDYERYLERVGWYANKTPTQRAVMRLARRLGETDLEVPPDFYQEVARFVQMWKSTPRFRNAMARGRERNLLKKIIAALDPYGLPREFLFLALQESDFDTTRVGPPTRFGHAKGLWQFIAPTATQYGLKLGQMKDLPKYDPFDQRHDEERSTQAAARYLAYLYSSKAAASGLLVIASYNYGETRIIRKLDELPNHPRHRNFWNFYRQGWIPKETREYVMYIFSAALICEDPRLFQVDMEPCLGP